jgi:ABC-type multidrug transport system ATPase subunit
LADELEQNILKGKIRISKTGEVNYIPDHAPEQNLGVHLTASLVKSLSNLVFYFRHLAKAGDYIIIDEPELNLHPDNQTLIARFLGRLINEGFKIITSTHSNYIIREINNLIMLTQPSEKTADLIKKYGYMTNQLINPTQIAGYLFKNNHSCPQSIEITEMGLGIETIDQVVTELNKSSQEIYLSLFN